MVQESGSKSNLNAGSAVSRKDNGYAIDPTMKKASQYGSKQYETSKSYSSVQKTDNAQKYGAWGGFKNKDNFVNMHLF